MKTAVFNTKSYDREFFQKANKTFHHELVFYDVHLTPETAKLAFGSPAVCVFVNCQLGRDVLTALHENGTRLIALRCAGFNNIDILSCRDLGITVLRVPAYSPHGVAEHTIALMLALNRKLHRAYNRVREGNFSLEGLMGWEFHGRTIGIAGTGKIGSNVARILKGFGCDLLFYDPYKNPELEKIGVYVSFEELLTKSDVITLHMPLSRETHHMINEGTIAQMKKTGAMLINTSRGGLIDTRAVIKGLKSGRVASLGLDVYEEEGDFFFENLSGKVIQDDVLARLLTFPNVILTAHQAFFTTNALENIAETTLKNIRDFEQGTVEPKNQVTAELISG